MLTTSPYILPPHLPIKKSAGIFCFSCAKDKETEIIEITRTRKFIKLFIKCLFISYFFAK